MTPRVIVPYPAGRTVDPWVQRILTSYDVDLRWAPLEGQDGYRLLLQDIWRAQQTVVLVEWDVVPWYGALEELYGCMGQWCSCAYRYRGGYGIFHGFGATKISATLMAALPTLWDTPCAWDVCDQRLWFAARDIGQEPHPHRPPVLHLSAKEYAEDLPLCGP